MRIDILAIGSLGDVQPNVALGRGLQRAGHRVRMVTLGGFERFVSGNGLEHLAIGESPETIANTAAGRDWIRRRASTIGFLRGFVRVARTVIADGIARYWSAAHDVDLIIATSMGLVVGVQMAERLQVPLIRMHTCPYAPTRYDYSGRRSLLTAARGDLVALTTGAFRFAIWGLLRKTTNDARRQILGLRPLPFEEPFRAMDRKHVPSLEAYSGAVVARPRDWGPWIHVTGYWFLDDDAGWTPSRELTDFLDSGPPPLFVGFGSTPFPNPATATDMVTTALARAGQRAVIVAGGSGLAKGRLKDEILSVDSVPHGWLFPRVCAAVHHGGAGVTGAALRAGLPSVVVPVFADQPTWAKRVFDLGAGPRPIPAARLTADRLADAIRATRDPGIRSRAAALGQRIRSEDGVACAVDVIHRHVGNAARV